MAIPGKRPGQRFKLDCGTEVQCVLAQDIPKRFIAAKAARDSQSCRAISTLRQGQWVYHDDPGYDEWESGGFYFSWLAEDADESDMDYRPDRCAVAVPVRYLEPEMNEYGEVSP